MGTSKRWIGFSRHTHGVIFTSAFDPKSINPEVKKFTSSYIKKYQSDPDNYAAEGYLGTQLVLEAFLKCGKNYSCIYSYLTQIKNIPSIFGNISFDTYGNVFYPFFLKTVRDGKFIPLEP